MNTNYEFRSRIVRVHIIFAIFWFVQSYNSVIVSSSKLNERNSQIIKLLVLIIKPVSKVAYSYVNLLSKLTSTHQQAVLFHQQRWTFGHEAALHQL